MLFRLWLKLPKFVLPRLVLYINGEERKTAHVETYPGILNFAELFKLVTDQTESFRFVVNSVLD
jgi:hypothetical protein